MSIDAQRKKLYKELKRIKDDYSYVTAPGYDSTHASDSHRKVLRDYFESELDRRFFDLLYVISAVPRKVKVPRPKDLDDYFRPGNYPYCLK